MKWFNPDSVRKPGPRPPPARAQIEGTCKINGLMKWYGPGSAQKTFTRVRTYVERDLGAPSLHFRKGLGEWIPLGEKVWVHSLPPGLNMFQALNSLSPVT